MITSLFSWAWFFGGANEVERLLVDCARGNTPRCVATVTAEMLLVARQNALVRQALMSADYRIADSVAIPMLHRLFFRHTPIRYPGSSMVTFLVQEQSLAGITIAVVGSSQEIVKRCNAKIDKNHWPNRLSWVPTPRIERQGSAWSGEEEIMNTLFTLKPNVIFVALGGAGNDRQEAWVVEHREKFPPSVGLVIGVGGALDMLAGACPRAPRWMQKIGMEWLWRLGQQPMRWRRIARAVLLFPTVTIFDILRARFYAR